MSELERSEKEAEPNWENFFKPEDFDNTYIGVPGLNCNSSVAICEITNQKLRAVIQACEKVYGNNTFRQYHGVPMNWDQADGLQNTHEARLIDVRKIEK